MFSEGELEQFCREAESQIRFVSHSKQRLFLTETRTDVRTCCHTTGTARAMAGEKRKVALVWRMAHGRKISVCNLELAASGAVFLASVLRSEQRMDGASILTVLERFSAMVLFAKKELRFLWLTSSR